MGLNAAFRRRVVRSTSILRCTIGQSMRSLAILLAFGFVCAAQAETDLEAGRKLFQTHCTVCHGPGGDGGKGTNLAQPRLPRASDDQALARIITLGIPGTEMPLTRMTPQQLASVIAYARSLGA